MCLLPQYEQVAIQKISKQLQDAGLFNKPGILQTVWVLHGLIDKGQTVTIDGVKHKRGATCPVAQETIAGMIDVRRRATAHGYLKDLIDAGILRVEKARIGGNNCYRYIFTIFDKYVEESKTCTDDDDSTDEDVRQKEKFVRLDDETCTAQGVHNQEVQERAPVLPDTCTSTNEESEKRGDDINLEDEDKGSPREKDFVPTAEIGNANDMVEKLTQAKSMNASEKDDSVESFVLSFNDAFGYETPVVTDLKLARAVSELQGHLGGMLSAASIDMPPLLFFKYCFRETNNRLASGGLTEKPKHPNFYRNTPPGKEIIELCVKKLGSENQATRDIERTKARNQALSERKPPSESDKKLTSDLIANLKPISADEAKRLRKLKE